jgi:hypothetical protein
VQKKGNKEKEESNYRGVDIVDVIYDQDGKTK